MHDLDPETRRNLHYAALPGKAASGIAVFLVCMFVGLLGVAFLAYVWSFVRPFLEGF